MPDSPYRCPLCREALKREAGRFCCPRRHSFDIAREGYVNLLPVQKKHSLQPGDSPQMLASRRRFLERGHYHSLRQALLARLQPLGVARLLDLGAGEGWYCGWLQQELADQQHLPEVYGIDISKTAIQLAAKRYPNCSFAVGSTHDLPFADQGFSHALNVFAPLKASEAARVLTPRGLLLRVSPAAGHLFELKTLLYAQAREHAAETSEIPGFSLINQDRLCSPFSLTSPEELRELIQMTPYAWKLQTEPAQLLDRAVPMTVRLDVWLSLYQKQSESNAS
ncbi:MAG: 23S rRNA (guanine(745)-N(1))-methyltransferase [Candidatus Sericytochromatia bacterium]